MVYQDIIDGKFREVLWGACWCVGVLVDASSLLRGCGCAGHDDNALSVERVASWYARVALNFLSGSLVGP